MSQSVEGLRCEAVLDLIEEYVDESLDHDVVESVRHHIEGCPSCAREHANAELTMNELRSLPSLEPPARVLARVATVVDAESATPSEPAFILRRVGWLAAAAAVVLAIGSVSLSRHQSATTDAEALRAAAEVQFALATIGEISERTNRIVWARVVDDGPIPQSFRGLARSLGPLASLKPADGPPAAPYEPTHEGSS